LGSYDAIVRKGVRGGGMEGGRESVSEKNLDHDH